MTFRGRTNSDRERKIWSTSVIIPVLGPEYTRMRPAEVAEDAINSGKPISVVLKALPGYRRARKELVTDLPKRVKELNN